MSAPVNNALCSTAIAVVIYLVILFAISASTGSTSSVEAIVVQMVICAVGSFALAYAISVYFAHRRHVASAYSEEE